jgi:hypothetical protein
MSFAVDPPHQGEGKDSNAEPLFVCSTKLAFYPPLVGRVDERSGVGV